MKILIADDDAVSRHMMQRMLRRAGYEVVTVEDGHAAMESLVRPDGPRLALLDWMMPGLDGPSVCRQVRERPDHAYVHITVLTSKDAKEDLVAALEAGADDYLTKPCNAEELKARLRAGQRILRLEDTLVRAREEMRFKATHDPLTALWNREAILARLYMDVDRARQNQTSISVLLGDIDHFKRINDVYGHLTGDKVLREIASRLRNAVRPADAIGRYGGEEFLIILEGCGKEELFSRAEQIRRAAEVGMLVGGAGALLSSISLGGAAIDASTAGLRPEALLSQADVALYRAKTEGRNRVVIAEGEPPDGHRQSSLKNSTPEQGTSASLTS